MKVISAFWFVVLVFVSSRCLVGLAAVVGQHFLPFPATEAFYRIHPELPLLDAAARWDSGFYLEIAQFGYRMSLGEISSVAFFPLYSLLIAVFTPLFGEAVLAGVIISHLCFLIGLVFLEKLTRQVLNPSAARVAVMAVAFFPTSFFFSAVYTESLFFMLTTIFFYAIQTKNLPLASVMALLASSTRFIGLLLCFLLLLEFWKNKKQWLWVFASGLGTLSYMGFLAYMFQDPIAFWTVQPAFGRQGFDPISALLRDLAPLFSGYFAWNVILDLSALGLVISQVPRLWRIRPSYGVYALLSLLIPLMSGTGSLSRYVLVVVPLLVLAYRLPRWLYWLSGGFLVIFTMLFSTWTFVA